MQGVMQVGAPTERQDRDRKREREERDRQTDRE
jgi:hypothetical protein